MKSKVDALIRMNPDYPSWIAGTPDPKDQPLAAFVHAATWADDIKKPEAGYSNDGEDATVAGALLNIGYVDRRTHRYWHYKDIEFSDPDGMELPPTPFVNGETIIKNFRDTLASEASPFVKSYDLVWLIHLVGDVHQPLHATERVTQKVRGDRGGNEIKVKPLGGNQVSLHQYWDGLLGDKATPQEAVEVAATLPIADPNRVAMTDPGEWVHESFDLARQLVYTSEIGLDAGPFTLSADYDAKAKDLAKVQAGVAGARLAKLLNDALKD